MKIAVLSDIHGNLNALEAVIDSFSEIDSIWCLGDIVGYGARPNDCIETLRSCGLHSLTISGNHDLGACGRLPLAGFNHEGKIALNWTRPLLSKNEAAFLDHDSVAGQPDQGIMLVHGSPRDPVWEYVSSLRIAEDAFPSSREPICFFGHTHLPMIYFRTENGSVDRFQPRENKLIPLADFGQQMLVNPGSVGQPRDLDPRSSFIEFDPEDRTVLYRRVPYQVGVTQGEIRAAGLPESLADRLAVGV